MLVVRLARMLLCKRCGYSWRPRQATVHMCPKCKSRHWQTARKDRRGLRPDS